MDRRDFLTLACLLPAGAVLAAPAAPVAAGLSLPAAINKAGRQRLLSQRTAKAWLMLVQGVLSEKAKSILGQSTQLFEQQLVELKTLQPNDDCRAALLLLEQEWGRYRPQLADIRSDAKAVWTGSEAVLAAAQKLTVAYERASGTPGGRLVNLAGRQRMLSQRAAKAYFFRNMGVNAGEAGQMLDGAMKEFIKGHEELKAAPQNTPQIKSDLALVEQQWFFFQHALSLREAYDQKKGASDVATTSERILEQMEAVVGQYEKVARDS